MIRHSLADRRAGTLVPRHDQERILFMEACSSTFETVRWTLKITSTISSRPSAEINLEEQSAVQFGATAPSFLVTMKESVNLKVSQTWVRCLRPRLVRVAFARFPTGNAPPASSQLNPRFRGFSA